MLGILAPCDEEPASTAMSDWSEREVPWLMEIQRPPAPSSSISTPLSPLLFDAGGAIETLEAWEAKREAIRRWWLAFLGPLADRPHRVPPLEVVSEERVGSVTRQLVRYPVEPGRVTEAYLLKPASCEAPTPGVIVFHSTVDESILEPAGLSVPSPKALGLTLAQRGFVALCPRNFLWRDNHTLAMRWQTLKFRCRRPGCRGMAKMLHDAVVALNLLAQIPEVDPTRLGAVGHSLGAKQALYLAAFDERIRVVASNEGGIGVKFSNWHAPWYLGRQVRAKSFRHDHHELLALVAPRSFLLLGGDGYDGAQSWPWIEAVLPVYRLFGSPARVGLFNHHRGHMFPTEAAERIHEWFQVYA